jgi:hypothetical protein
MIHLEHSPLGGSGAHRFLVCDGSFLLHREQLEDGTHENIESEFAKRGTGAHELGARCLVEDAEPFEFLGESFNGYLAGWPDGIELDAVQVYVNDCRAILDATAARPREVLVERTIHLPAIHPLFKGTVDFGVLTATKLWLRDYKNGEGIGVAAVNNKQLLYYAALMIRENRFWEEIPRDMPVSLGICQPNFYGIFEEVDVWETTVGFVLDFLDNVLLPKMRELEAERDLRLEDFVSGEHCQFCPVLLDCPRMRAAFEMYAAASEDFIAMLTNEELDRYYTERENARRFMKALEETVYARKIAGGDIPSAKLVEKQTARVWKPGAQAALVKAFGNKAFKERELISPAGAEKLSSTGKALALEWGYKPEADRLTIAPLSDRRAEAKPRGNATVFEHVAAEALSEF